VSLSQAGVHDPRRTKEQREQAGRDVAGVVDTFFRQTGWHPRWTEPVAGALLYTQYNFFIRFVMKQISKRAGGSVDTSRDHEYTDWAALEHFAGTLVSELTPSRPSLLMPVPTTL
jgi:menaquinone-dependent protoporphyrinogen oxidase